MGEYLKVKNPQIRIVAAEPSDSPVLSGRKERSSQASGIGAQFSVPEVLNTRDIYDEIIQTEVRGICSVKASLAKRRYW